VDSGIPGVLQCVSDLYRDGGYRSAPTDGARAAKEAGRAVALAGASLHATIPRMADLNQMAYRVVQHATEPQEPETSAQASGREGGKKGGKARAEKLTPKARSEIARTAARARWSQKA
jgi:hypothetical protein